MDNKRKQPATPSGVRTRSTSKRQCVDNNSVTLNANKAGRVSSSTGPTHKVMSNKLISEGDSPRKITLRQGSRKLNTFSRCAAPAKGAEEPPVKVKIVKKVAKKDSKKEMKQEITEVSNAIVESPMVPEFTELSPIEMAPLFSEFAEQTIESDDDLADFDSFEEDEDETDVKEKEEVKENLISYKLDEDEEEEDSEQEDEESEDEIPKFEYISARKNSMDSQYSTPSLTSSLSSSPSGSLLSSPMLDISLDSVDLPVSELDISSTKVHFELAESNSVKRWPIENVDFSSSFSILLRQTDPVVSKKDGGLTADNEKQHGSNRKTSAPLAPTFKKSAPASTPPASKTDRAPTQTRLQPQQPFPSQPQYHLYGPHFIPYGAYPMAPGPHGPIPMVPGPHLFLHYPPHMQPSMGMAPPHIPQQYNQAAPLQASAPVAVVASKAAAVTKSSSVSVQAPEPTELDDFVDYNSAGDECSLGSLFAEQQPKVPLCGYRDRNNQSILATAPPNRNRAVAAVLSSISTSDPASTVAADKKELFSAYYQQAIMAAQGLNRRSLLSGSAQQMFCGN
jgi:hypothetical protein